MKNKSYDYIYGNGKFNTWFNIIVSIISCSAISFCLTELLFFFDFKVSFQKVLIFTILFVILLLLFYYFIKQRTYKLCFYFCSLLCILGAFNLVKYFAVKKWEIEK